MAEVANGISTMRFRDVVDEHQRGVYRLALQLTGHHQDAEDLMQDVFIKVHAKLDSFRGEASIKSWIYRITVNTYLNKRRKKALLFMKLRDDFDNTLTDARSNTERDAESNSIREHVHKALELCLPKNDLPLLCGTITNTRSKKSLKLWRLPKEP